MFANKIKIGKKVIGAGNPSFIIAEAGVNHNGEMKIAKMLVDEARRVGADAVKFQSFKAERLVSVGTPKVKHHKNSGSQKETHFDMIKKLELSEEFQKKLFNYCKKKGIIFLSTPYDVPSAQYLNKLGVKAFKTASADIVDLPLHEYIAKTGKPSIVAVGMATYEEIERVVSIYKRRKNPNVVLLHCVSSYPAKSESLNLKVIPELGKRFGTIVGYSDHSIGSTAVIAARALGAEVFEKHFTLDKDDEGPDHKTSEEPKEFKKLVDSIREAEIELGSKEKKLQPEEKSMHAFSRKSLIAACDIPKGAIITAKMLTLKRPGYGIPYAKIKTILGRASKVSIKRDSIITYKLLSNK